MRSGVAGDATFTTTAPTYSVLHSRAGHCKTRISSPLFSSLAFGFRASFVLIRQQVLVARISLSPVLARLETPVAIDLVLVLVIGLSYLSLSCFQLGSIWSSLAFFADTHSPAFDLSPVVSYLLLVMLSTQPSSKITATKALYHLVFLLPNTAPCFTIIKCSLSPVLQVLGDFCHPFYTLPVSSFHAH